MKTERISQLKVLKSAAGYYIGRTYFDEEMGVDGLPYSRDSGYFCTEEEADFELKIMIEEDF